MNYVLNLKDLDKKAISVVGGKNASLGEMIKAGIHVPPGFAVTTDCYLKFISETGIDDKIYETLKDVQPEDVSSLDRASERIKACIQEGSISGDIREAIEYGYLGLCRACAVADVPVAVRSSATAEDLPTASFAGQQDTYLWIQGVYNVISHVQSCWASLFTPRAIAYRIKNQFPHEKVFISVGVQKMVNSRTAGVLFTLNPTNGDPSKVVIEGSWGLGETVVSGSVNPDRFVVDKVIMEASVKEISAKHIECVFDVKEGRVINANVDPKRQCTCCLQDEEIRELVKIAKHIEKHYGCPMDIEWAIDADLGFPESIFIVQARPETVWSRRKAESVIGKKSGYDLLMEQAMKRIRIPQ
ncbi:MAG: hypothetical protein A2V65_01120 [Deltaproteobacteria bacterium RBG_13_49_15]|nr:MAG: hypothetical protein A2V65_01120 [Deltaproteobacteria bacterium RBG_13_49_15]